LPKADLAGTTYLFFVVANSIKLGPWLLLVELSREFYLLFAISIPVMILATWNGWLLHERVILGHFQRHGHVSLRGTHRLSD